MCSNIIERVFFFLLTPRNVPPCFHFPECELDSKQTLYLKFINQNNDTDDRANEKKHLIFPKHLINSEIILPFISCHGFGASLQGLTMTRRERARQVLHRYNHQANRNLSLSFYM